MIVQSIISGAIKPFWISVDVRSILNNSTRANLSRVKRSSYGDASLNRKMFDRNSKQKTSASLETPSNTLSRKQGSSKSNGCLKCAALKGGGLHAPPVDIGLLYLGMHASDAAVFAGPEPSNVRPIPGWWIFNVRFWETSDFGCKCPILQFYWLVRSVVLSHYLK